VDLEVIVSQSKGRVPVAILHLKGRLNLGSLDKFNQAVQSALNSGTVSLVFDLAELESISSAGLGVLVSLAKSLNLTPSSAKGVKTPRSTNVKLAAPSPSVSNVLEIAGFDWVFEIFDRVEDAVASF